jgi:mRNA interferase MazF
MSPGDVYWCDLTHTGGREQSGRRPVIVLQDDSAHPKQSPLVIMVPLTSQLATLRFPATVRIDPTSQNGLASPSVALVYQIRAIDRRNFGPFIGVIDQATLDDIHQQLDTLMGR